MRFVSFSVDGLPSYGIITGKGVYDLGIRIGDILPDLKSFLDAKASGILAPIKPPTEADYKLTEIEFDPVIANPAKILCIGLNYEEHRVETGRDKSEKPTIFTRFADTLIGHKAEMVRPNVSKAFDYEAELAVIIGQHCRDVPRDQAMSMVAGYTCFNDGTLRDWQRHTTQFTPGKNFAATGPLGPEMVTPDEAGELGGKSIESRLNGKVMQKATLGDMIFPIDLLIHYISSFTALAPGDIIATGTPGGVGFKREPQVFMKAGDRIEVVIDGIGHLINPIIDEEDAEA